ncbi:MAG TPA: hypothetical protein VLZ78_09950 [Terrimesophilobacter sp.]|nr:hypothetical protein [Terrimesophilobacter sp.]
MTSQVFQNFSVVFWLLAGAVFLINLLIGVLVGNAARSKDRSFGSFFWLSFFMGCLIPALVVAALPFRRDDPRHPENTRA